MSIYNIAQQSVPLSIPYASPISSKDLSDFTKAIVSDVSNLTDVINVVIQLLNGLKIDELDPNNLNYTLLPKMSAKHIPLDTDYPLGPLGELFGDISLQETIGILLQIIANIDNGLKHGIKQNNVSFSANQSKSFTWNYGKDAFIYKVYKNDTNNNLVDVTNLFSASINYTGTAITITNTTGDSHIVNIVVWKPNFLF